tara:strand:+ start:127 stop:516 length:390 start_codon:yes stop_codon:yes gene_type:complete
MTTWDVENETYAEFKKRRSAESGISGMGQKKREGTGKINKSDLRAEALKRANYTCEWPNCYEKKWLEMAHLIAIGMGGKNRDISNDPMNVCILCKNHHDIFDGRQQYGTKREYTELLKGFLILQWRRNE